MLAELLLVATLAADNAPADLPVLVASASAGRVQVHVLRGCPRCGQEVQLQWLGPGRRIVQTAAVPELGAAGEVTRLEAEWSPALAPRFTLKLSSPHGAEQVVVIEATGVGQYRVHRP